MVESVSMKLMPTCVTTLASGGLLLFVLAACSSANAPVDAAGGGGPCASYVEALVAYRERCGDAEGTTAHARARFEAACKRSLAAPGAADLGAQLLSCGQNLANATCGDEIDCEATRGALDDGAPCG